MDIISTALTIAHGIRVVVAALKGETALVLTSRQLMHSCQLYEDCLVTLQKSLQDQQNALNAQYGSSSGDHTATMDLQKTLNQVKTQVELDTVLLRSILKESESIAESKASKNFLHNVFISVSSGRIKKVHTLGDELMVRVQLITALMTKEVWKSSNGLDSQTMDLIGDVDGSMFWFGYFKSERRVSFGAFMEAYQSYLTQTYFFRNLDKMHLSSLLKHSLLEDLSSLATDAALMSAEVTVTSFATWLRRYGPMKDTLHRACVVVQPARGTPVLWFHKGMSRDMAQRLLTTNLATYSSGIEAHHLIVVRYSSDPKVQFVVTTQIPNSPTIENYPILNSALGYSIVGAVVDHQQTLTDCIQKHILDKVFVKPSVTLSQVNVQEWDSIFASVTVDLPADHYPDVDSLNEAAKKLSQSIHNDAASGSSTTLYGGGGGVSAEKNSATFSKLFGVSEKSKTSNTTPDITRAWEGSANASPPQKVSTAPLTTPTPPAATSSSYATPTPPATASVSTPNTANLPASEKVVAAKYMIHHGVDILQQQGALSEAKINLIRDLLKGL